VGSRTHSRRCSFRQKIQYLSAAATDVEIGGNDRVIIDYVPGRSICPAFERLNNARRRGPIRAVGPLKSSIGTLSMAELLARSEALDTLAQRATDELVGDGVRVIDVRINRTELPLASQKATFEQMREQRRAIAREKRAIGEREAREIRARRARGEEISQARMQPPRSRGARRA
jgi:membrane protease subunit HflC